MTETASSLVHAIEILSKARREAATIEVAWRYLYRAEQYLQSRLSEYLLSDCLTEDESTADATNGTDPDASRLSPYPQALRA